MSKHGCKVDAAIEKYELTSLNDEFESLDAELLARWKGKTGREPLGYRSLATIFNKHLLRTVYKTHGRVVLGTRLEDELATLTGGDEIARGELLDTLDRDGIDGEAVCADLVSFSTLRRHLTECLGGEKPRQRARTDWEQNSVEIATETLEEKVHKALSSYETKGRIGGATDADVSVQIQLSCPHCPTRRSLREALRIGHICEDHLSDAGDNNSDI